jgi:hypothetical protein
MSDIPSVSIQADQMAAQIWAGLSADSRQQAVTLLVQLAVQRVVAAWPRSPEPPGKEQPHAARPDHAQDPT